MPGRKEMCDLMTQEKASSQAQDEQHASADQQRLAAAQRESQDEEQRNGQSQGGSQRLAEDQHADQRHKTGEEEQRGPPLPTLLRGLAHLEDQQGHAERQRVVKEQSDAIGTAVHGVYAVGPGP